MSETRSPNTDEAVWGDVMASDSRNTQIVRLVSLNTPRIKLGTIMPAKNRRKSNRPGKKAHKTKMADVPYTMKLAPISNAVYRFVYSENFVLNAAAGVGGATGTLSLNNLYDPNISGTGYQPIGFDQMSAIWNNYRVLKIRVKAEWLPTGVAHSVGMYPSGFSTLSADPVAWTVQPFSRTRLTSTTTPVVLQQTYLPWNVLGIKKQNYMAENDYLSSSSGGPVRPTYLHIFAKNFDNGTATSAPVRVTLEYVVLASQPNYLGMS